MSNESKALELAEAYADAVSTHRLECLYGTSKSYTLEKAKERDELHSALIAELRRQHAEIESLRAQIAARVPDGCVVADVGFRWDGERLYHIPKLVVEFEPVPANSPIDAKGWKDRDAVAAMLSAAPQPAQQVAQRVRCMTELGEGPERNTMSIECGICERDLRGGHAEDCPRHPKNSTAAGPREGVAVINGHRYRKTVMQVARVTHDGTTCVVAAGDLLDILSGGGEYAVRLETMRVAEFERMEEFTGW